MSIGSASPAGAVAEVFRGKRSISPLGYETLAAVLAVLDRWDCQPIGRWATRRPRESSRFHRLYRDIYVPANDTGFWQGAFREPAEPIFAVAREAIAERRAMTIDLLYGDHEGGQRTISRFALLPAGDDQWLRS